jgi:hypothetical protein
MSDRAFPRCCLAIPLVAAMGCSQANPPAGASSGAAATSSGGAFSATSGSGSGGSTSAVTGGATTSSTATSGTTSTGATGAASLGTSSSGGSSGGSLPLQCQGGPCWQPPVDTRWYYQLSAPTGSDQYPETGGVDVGITSVPYTGGAAVAPLALDIDLYQLVGDTSAPNAAAVTAIHAAGAFAICYVDAGTWENWRPDASQFPASVLGAQNGWPGEQWLDIRQTSILLPLMQARLVKCVQAGFDAVEWDNVDGYANTTGFPLTAQDQLDYDEQLANLAHRSGLGVALKNDTDQVGALVSYFDFEIDEQCQEYAECDSLAPFATAGKAIFQVEYDLTADQFCPQANQANRNAALCDLNLTGTWTPCR